MEDRLLVLQRSVGRRVSELRLAKELTQRELGERCEIDIKYMQDIEGGRQNLTLKTLLRLADALEADLVDLFEAPKSLHAPRGPGRPRRGNDKA